nr:reverse transcriptase domain-containing protein [Tanacetum cinerariifolium]
MTVIENKDNEIIPTGLVMGWRVCIDYRKLNDATRKDHFSLPFMDQMLERLAKNEYYCFLDGFSGYFQIPIDPQDQKKTTFTCPYGGDFILEEIKTCLRSPNELSNLEDDDFDMKGDIALIEKLLNEDPPPNLPPVKNDDLNQVGATMTKPSNEEPLELELKDLPSYLEYAFLEGTDKLPVIISKELKYEEKVALLKVLKSHKQAIA